MVTIELKVNGRVSKVEVGPYTTLLEVLRDKLAVPVPRRAAIPVIVAPVRSSWMGNWLDPVSPMPCPSMERK